MSYKIVSVSDTLHVVRPKRWYSVEVSFEDLVEALVLLGNVVSVTKYWDWWHVKYIVITRGEGG